MATVKLILERSRALKDGTYSIVFQIIHRRARKLIYTSYRINEQEFDGANERVLFISSEIRKKKEVASINSIIKKQRKCIDTHIDELEGRGHDYIVAEITARYHIENDSLSLIGYFDSQIERKLEMERLGTVRAYTYTRGSVAKFINHHNIRISDVTFSFISEYERFLIKSKISANTICFHIRNFKTIYNQALMDGYTTPEKHPFKYVQTKQQKTAKRALDRNSLLRIKELNLDGKDTLGLSRDLFLFSFYSRGMSMIDMVSLTSKNIKNKVISYHRQKTNQCIEIAVTSELDEIIRRYQNESDYIFPVLKGETLTERYKHYRSSVERTNRQLKKISQMLELETPLTTYVARHSWATQAKKAGIPISVISEGLGHTSEKTTQIYLKAFDRSELDKANEKVAKLLK